jgi:hypothetical protein
MKQHLLLGNRFLIIKYTQLLLDNTFAHNHVPMETMSTTMNGIFYTVWGDVITKTSLGVSCNRVSCQREFAVEESPLLEAVTWEKLVKLQQTEKT